MTSRCLYKEVQGYWDSPAGETKLEAADDIILLWTDDNWGNVRRVPTASENERSGGAGLYFHFDYVGVRTAQLLRIPPSSLHFSSLPLPSVSMRIYPLLTPFPRSSHQQDPKNYKWLNTNNIAKVYEQLSLALGESSSMGSRKSRSTRRSVPLPSFFLDFGADQFWILNVGDLRPMEVSLAKGRRGKSESFDTRRSLLFLDFSCRCR